MVLYIVHQTAYIGHSDIEGYPLGSEERDSYPVPLRNKLRIMTQVSNKEPSGRDDRFCGCCRGPLPRQTIELKEQQFLAHRSWDLYAVSETTHKAFHQLLEPRCSMPADGFATDNDTAILVPTKPSTVTVVRFALVPQSLYHNSMRTWPYWTYLGECLACMLRLVVEENIRPVLPTPTTHSSPTFHFHMDIFADAISVDMPCRLVLRGHSQPAQPPVAFAPNAENKTKTRSATSKMKRDNKSKKARSTNALRVISNQQKQGNRNT